MPSSSFSCAASAIMLLISGAVNASTISTFDDLTLAPESFFDGNLGSTQGEPNASTFTSGPATYHNTITDFGGGVTAWQGWAYSNKTDSTTPGFANQYSAFPGKGFNSENYGVAFTGAGDSSIVDFSAPTQLSGAYFTNTTYAGLSIRDGDSFAKKFGGADGNAPDFFLMTVTGKDSNNVDTGTVELYLADYRFSDNSQDFILDDWTWTDLSALGTVSSLEFALNSSDIGQFGMNTPGFFAMDNLTAVPLPPALFLFVGGLFMLGRATRTTIGKA